MFDERFLLPLWIFPSSNNQNLVLQLDDTLLECSKLVRLQSYGWGELRTVSNFSNTDYMQDNNLFGIDPFFIEKGIHFTVFIMMVVKPKSDFFFLFSVEIFIFHIVLKQWCPYL